MTLAFSLLLISAQPHDASTVLVVVLMELLTILISYPDVRSDDRVVRFPTRQRFDGGLRRQHSVKGGLLTVENDVGYEIL